MLFRSVQSSAGLFTANAGILIGLMLDTCLGSNQEDIMQVTDSENESAEFRTNKHLACHGRSLDDQATSMTCFC